MGNIFQQTNDNIYLSINSWHDFSLITTSNQNTHFMKNVLLFIVVPVLFFLSSCAYHAGYSTGGIELSSGNFNTVKKNAQGKAEAFYVFGFGGLQKKAIVAEAKQNLMLQNQVKDNQQLANVIVDYKTSFFVVVSKFEVTVTADIVEFK